jgi:hypothetical protein
MAPASTNQPERIYWVNPMYTANPYSLTPAKPLAPPLGTAQMLGQFSVYQALDDAEIAS